MSAWVGVRVVVAGGGVVGLAVAWRLAELGADVTVVEKGEVGGGASSAAAGMLAPRVEGYHHPSLLRLGLAGRDAYGPFLAHLEKVTGEHVPVTVRGALVVGQAPGPQGGKLLDPEDIRAAVGGWSGPTEGVYWVPDEAELDPGDLLRALQLAALQAGVRVLAHREVVGESGGYVHLQDGTRLPWDRMVVAAGSWSGELGRRLGLQIPVRPVRGQLVALDTGGTVSVRHLCFGPGVYLTPKRGGRVWVGATQEEAGFAAVPHARGVHDLLQAAFRLVPALADCRFVGTWSGLRPASSDGLPLIGPHPARPEVILATGHFRNGILLAPLTASLVAEGADAWPEVSPRRLYAA